MRFDFKYIDHIAYVFPTIDSGLSFFQYHPGFRILHGPGKNIAQGVNYLFISIDGLGTIELLSPIDKESPVSQRLESLGGHLYHICYAVENIEETVTSMKLMSWQVICPPIEDIAFGGRRVAFLYSNDAGLVELVEALPKELLVSRESAQEIAVPSQRVSNRSRGSDQGSMCDSIACILKDSISTYAECMDRVSSFDDIPEWDSLAYAVFHARFEDLIGNRVDANRFEDLADYITYYRQSKPS